VKPSRLPLRAALAATLFLAPHPACPSSLATHGPAVPASPPPASLAIASPALHGPTGILPDQIPTTLALIGPFEILSNGAIRTQTRDPSAETQGDPASDPASLTVLYQFGLPEDPPIQRWREQDSRPVFHSLWDKDGIRYTQSILIARLHPDDPIPPNAKLPPDAVLLMQLAGLSLASEYTDATASFEVQFQDQTFPLSLDRTWVYTHLASAPLLLAQIDVPAEGIAAHTGSTLRFRGHMPPGLSGAMTVKIPLGPLSSPDDLDRLHDLEFEEELRRLKRSSKPDIDPEFHTLDSLLVPVSAPGS
jgi:hypothetical protein